MEAVGKAAFLAGVLSTWKEALEELSAPTRLLLAHEAEAAFQAEARLENKEATHGDMVCAERYVSVLAAMRPQIEIGSPFLAMVHRKVFDHPDGYRYFPGEFRTDEVGGEFNKVLNEITGRTGIDVFSRIHLIHAAFLKLSPFRAGNHVIANALLHALFVHSDLTPSPMLPLAKFTIEGQTTTSNKFLQSVLRAEERTQSVYQSVRIIEARYRDSVASLETRPRKVASELLPYFMEREMFTVRDIETAYGKKNKITYHTLNKLMTRLVDDLHVLTIVSESERNRIFTLKGYQTLFV